MKKIVATVVSVHAGTRGKLHAEPRERIEVELDGIIGDRHRSYTRDTWAGDKQAKGTTRRNERQWSAVSLEELTAIEKVLDLNTTLTAACLGANLCISGLPDLSRLPKGTLLQFPSGAEFIVEEYNPPCHDISKQVAALYTRSDGAPLMSTAFSKAAKLTRGIVGVVEAAGTINAGDAVTVVYYKPPA